MAPLVLPFEVGTGVTSGNDNLRRTPSKEPVEDVEDLRLPPLGTQATNTTWSFPGRSRFSCVHLNRASSCAPRYNKILLFSCNGRWVVVMTGEEKGKEKVERGNKTCNAAAFHVILLVAQPAQSFSRTVAHPVWPYWDLTASSRSQFRLAPGKNTHAHTRLGSLWRLHSLYHSMFIR
jgi:hypothetical protein